MQPSIWCIIRDKEPTELSCSPTPNRKPWEAEGCGVAFSGPFVASITGCCTHGDCSEGMCSWVNDLLLPCHHWAEGGNGTESPRQGKTNALERPG